MQPAEMRHERWGVVVVGVGVGVAGVGGGHVLAACIGANTVSKTNCLVVAIPRS